MDEIMQYEREHQSECKNKVKLYKTYKTYEGDFWQSGVFYPSVKNPKKSYPKRDMPLKDLLRLHFCRRLPNLKMATTHKDFIRLEIANRV